MLLKCKSKAYKLRLKIIKYKSQKKIIIRSSADGARDHVSDKNLIFLQK